MKHITHSEIQTFNLGKKVASQLKAGGVISLTGELGAGKTVFVKGLAVGLGVEQVVNSPTFVLMKIYPTKHSTVKQIVHIDCYRLKESDEIVNVGALEYFNRPDTVTVIEWAEKIKKNLPQSRQKILIEIKNVNDREITIT
ncbi:MAG: tRNA (adenosine(37)-N6)-threonylcarbamoyltransferase complex ATPase subunit type 1 TsaE [Parcubacteria group bacterium]|nr:tRNA (adenosine(37)-N6)-threonylcarbamoyltransferase complex ATPase subunit type 1 TsaE [Parcubacteria group bacterium]|tara:strand:- start:1025 stop:1447 length:423 start_codon:yes stop_codon:yes gene_type:complete